MNIYDEIKNNFYKASEYSKNSIIQNKVHNILLRQSQRYAKLINYHQIHKILNLGVRDFREPLELNNAFNPLKIDVGDIVLPKNSTAIKNIKTFKLNFDKDLGQVSNDYDLIFSNMSFQWSQNLEKLIQNITQKLNNRSILAFSTVLEDNFHEVRGLLRINKMHSTSNILTFIKQANLKCLYSDDFYLNLKFDNFKALIKHLKSTGVNTYTGNENNQNYKNLKKLYLSSDQFSLSYHIGLFICFKE